MARIRSVKPEFWEDENIATLTPLARLLFIATWNMADDEGRLRWNSAYVRANAFVYDGDEIDVPALMAELVSAGFVEVYEGGKTGQLYGVIPTFKEHQRPNRPQASKLPAPPSLSDSLPDSVNGSLSGSVLGTNVEATACSAVVESSGVVGTVAPVDSAVVHDLLAGAKKALRGVG